MYVKYNSFNSYSMVFDFGGGENSDNVKLYNDDTTSAMKLGVFQGSADKSLAMSNFDSSTWTHVVVTIASTTLKV